MGMAPPRGTKLENLSLSELSYWVWGDFWKTNPGYLELMMSISNGRSESSVANDLRERLRYWNINGTPTEAGPFAVPYYSEC